MSDGSREQVLYAEAAASLLRNGAEDERKRLIATFKRLLLNETGMDYCVETLEVACQEVFGDEWLK